MRRMMPSFSLLPQGLRPQFTARDLVFIGIFAAVIKAASLVIALAGGGMNPLTLILKNFVYAALMLVLLHKVPKPWTLTVAVLITCLVSLMLMGQRILQIPGTLAASFIVEMLVFTLGGYGRTLNLILGVLLLELLTKAVSIGIAYIMLREQPALIIVPLIFVCIGYLGTLGGLVGGVRFVKELRHASFLS